MASGGYSSYSTVSNAHLNSNSYIAIGGHYHLGLRYSTTSATPQIAQGIDLKPLILQR